MPYTVAENFVFQLARMAEQRRPEKPGELEDVSGANEANITGVEVQDETHPEDTRVELTMHDGSKATIITEIHQDRVWLAAQDPGNGYRKKEYPPTDPRQWEMIESTTNVGRRTVEYLVEMASSKRKTRERLRGLELKYCLCTSCCTDMCEKNCAFCHSDKMGCSCQGATPCDPCDPECNHPNCSEEAYERARGMLAEHAKKHWTKAEVFPPPKPFREYLIGQMRAQLQGAGITSDIDPRPERKETTDQEEERMLRAGATHAIRQWFIPFIKESGLGDTAREARNWDEMRDALRGIAEGTRADSLGMAVLSAENIAEGIGRLGKEGRAARARTAEMTALEIAALGRHVNDARAMDQRAVYLPGEFGELLRSLDWANT